MSQAPNSTGLTSSQMEQLCQPEQLERTLRLLFDMNHWAKARERLFFVDRQGQEMFCGRDGTVKGKSRRRES